MLQYVAEGKILKITAGILFYWLSRKKETQHIAHKADRIEIRELQLYAGQKEAEPGVLYLLPGEGKSLLFCCGKKTSITKEHIRNKKEGISLLKINTGPKEDAQDLLLREWNNLLKMANGMLEKILSQEDVADVMESAQGLLAEPFVLVDRDMQLLYGPASLAREMTESLGEGYSSEIIEELLMSKDFHNVAAQKEPFYYYMKITDQHSYCCNILVDDIYYARLVVNTKKGETRLESGAEQITEYLGEMIVRMIRSGALRLHQGQNDRRHVLLGQIADGMRPEKDEIRKAFGHPSSEGRYQVLCLEPFKAVGWETQMETTLPVMMRKLEQTWPESVAATSGKQILWLIRHQAMDKAKDTYAFFQKLLILLRENVFRAGVSSFFSDITAIPDAFDQASSALWIGSGKEESYWFFRFDDYRLDYMLASLRGNKMDQKLLLHPAVTMLAEYDRAHEGSLSETLKTFIEKKQNVTQAAEALFVHRTTLFRRLNQIRELTGIDLEDQRECLTLQLSYYLLEENKQ
uniref:Putative transcriptional regulator, PucR family n=1 Tax=uncultured bacterium Contig1450 TaxID=1393427 RepID=W0FHD4_9BACT|nr:putative transcriptional regulator, PucR family [uncultured bacterium Contig1450]